MKSFTARLVYLVCMLVLRVFMNSSLVYGASDELVRDHTTPDALVTVALFAGVDGAGMTSQGIYTVANGNIDAPAASPLGTGFHDKGAVHPDTNSPVGRVNRSIQRTHTPCLDSCSL
jgi:hypothetical protein